MKAPSRRLSNVEFFKLCELLRNNREQVIGTIHSFKKLAEYLSKESGLEVSDGSVPSLLDAVGIELEKDGKTKANEGRIKTTRILVRSMCQLLNKLGEKIDPDLLDLYQRTLGKPFAKADMPQPEKVNGIPLKDVQPSQRIPAVNLK